MKESISENQKSIIFDLINSKNDKEKYINFRKLLSELIANNQTINSEIKKELERCILNGLKLNFIFDIIDFIFDYGNKFFVSNIIESIHRNIYYLNSNKGKELDYDTENKRLFLIKKWAETKVNNIDIKGLIKNDFNTIKSKKIKFPTHEIKTYLNYITEEEIMIEKEVLIHRDKINLNDIKATIFRKNIEDKQTNDVTEPSNIRITEGIIDSKIYEEKIIEKNPIDDKKYSDNIYNNANDNNKDNNNTNIINEHESKKLDRLEPSPIIKSKTEAIKPEENNKIVTDDGGQTPNKNKDPNIGHNFKRNSNNCPFKQIDNNGESFIDSQKNESKFNFFLFSKQNNNNISQNNPNMGQESNHMPTNINAKTNEFRLFSSNNNLDNNKNINNRQDRQNKNQTNNNSQGSKNNIQYPDKIYFNNNNYNYNNNNNSDNNNFNNKNYTSDNNGGNNFHHRRSPSGNFPDMKNFNQNLFNQQPANNNNYYYFNNFNNNKNGNNYYNNNKYNDYNFDIYKPAINSNSTTNNPFRNNFNSYNNYSFGYNK